jgi:hypothetical protein
VANIGSQRARPSPFRSRSSHRHDGGRHQLSSAEIFPANSLILKQRGEWPIFRIDHNLTKNNSLVVRWLLRETPYVLDNGLPDLIWTRERRYQQSAVGDTHIFSPAIVNNFRLATRRTTSLTEKRKPDRHPLLAARSSPPSACKGRIRASCPARDFLK